MRDNLSFLGLGVMGYAMAGHLARAGHRVTVYNRTRARAERWLAEHGTDDCRIAASPREAAEGVDIVFACVGADDDVRAVCLGPEGAFAGMTAGAIFVDHTTASAALAREMAGEAERRDLAFLDAPVSGGEAGAVEEVAGAADASQERAEGLTSKGSGGEPLQYREGKLWGASWHRSGCAPRCRGCVPSGAAARRRGRWSPAQPRSPTRARPPGPQASFLP